MVIKTIHECDRCGTRCEFDSFYPVVGFQTGVNGTEDHTEAVDLCYACCQFYVRTLIGSMSQDQAQTFVFWAKTKMKTVSLRTGRPVD